MQGANCQNRTAEEVSGNIFIRKLLFPQKGDFADGHAHNFDHTTILFKGKVHLKMTEPNGTVTEKDMVAPDYVLIKAENSHSFVALENNTEFWCVYSHRNAQGDVIQDHEESLHDHNYK